MNLRNKRLHKDEDARREVAEEYVKRRDAFLNNSLTPFNLGRMSRVMNISRNLLEKCLIEFGVEYKPYDIKGSHFESILEREV